LEGGCRRTRVQGWKPAAGAGWPTFSQRLTSQLVAGASPAWVDGTSPGAFPAPVRLSEAAAFPA